MTTARTFSVSEGDFGSWQDAGCPCRRCKSALATFARCWESHDGGYEDWQYRCLACGLVWWVDGIDS
jgi:hypothetical protein